MSTTAPDRRNEGPFHADEPVWAGRPDGPRVGQDRWDLAPVTVKISQGERYVHLDAVPEGYRESVRTAMVVIAQPDHPVVVAAGIVLRATPARPISVYDNVGLLRTIAAWGKSSGLQSFHQWTQNHCAKFLEAVLTGAHRPSGAGVALSTARQFVTALRLMRTCSPLLADGLTFRPWGAMAATAVVGEDAPGPENETDPLPWLTWAPTVSAAWTLLDLWSPDIIRANRMRSEIPAEPRGPSGSQAWERLVLWNADSGDVPMHTGFGHVRAPRGTINWCLLCRLLGINEAIFKPVNSSYRPAAVDLVRAAAEDPDRAVLGGLIRPSVFVQHEGAVTPSPWVSEIGLGECEHLASILRAACYVVIACLTGMRDGEIQELQHDSITTKDGWPALRAVQYKGRASSVGDRRSWWAPSPVLRAVSVLSELSPHPTYLFARATKNAGTYAPQRDVPRLVEFVNGDPGTRIGRGAGLGLQRIAPCTEQINATSLRRSFAVYATTHAGAELGLGIQLGHAAWRMTSGYMSDGQQIAVGHLDGQRQKALGELARELITSRSPVAGPAARRVEQVRAQVVADPGEADKLTEQLASRLYAGLTNDCMWNTATSGCGSDGPHLADHACVGDECTNALVWKVHAGAYRDGIRRIDKVLARERIRPELREMMQRSRANYARILRRITEED